MFGSSKEKVVVASAPGKVLLAGGYLVLDRRYTGLVFGLSARIHVVVQRNEEDLVVVRSPQFKEAEWRYKVTDLKNGAAFDVKQMEDRYVYNIHTVLPENSTIKIMLKRSTAISCEIVIASCATCSTFTSVSTCPFPLHYLHIKIALETYNSHPNFIQPSRRQKPFRSSRSHLHPILPLSTSYFRPHHHYLGRQ